MGKIIPFLILVVAIGIAYIWLVLLGDKPVPVLPSNPYWGPSSKKGLKEDTSIRPFKINIDEKILKDLKTRLTLETSVQDSRLISPLEGIGFQYGFNTNYLKTVAKYWLEKYDWKAREKILNKYPQFKTTIAGLEIHFQHVKSTNNGKYKATRPLLLLHGWPGSFVEFQKVIPLLTDPANSAVNFELIIPSIPGYGFSERASVLGLGPLEIAQVFGKLMIERLGFKTFYLQGGDWGSIITTHIATLFPENTKGLHINLCITFNPKSLLKHFVSSIEPTWFMKPEDVSVGYPFFGKFVPLALEETGYMHLQATKPDTIGVSLSNSPTGLLAYILEKFSSWTNIDWRRESNGGLEPYYKLEELLDNIMVYWVTNSITSSVRLYSEWGSHRQMSYLLDFVPVKNVPTACLQPGKEEIYGSPKMALYEKYPELIRYNVAKKGGHFTAFEVPELLAKDLISFVNDIEKLN